MTNAPARSWTTGELAAMLEARLVGDADIRIDGLDSLDRGAPGTLSFIRSERFAEDWATSRASAALVSRPAAAHIREPRPGEGRAILVVPDADVAMIRALELFAVPAERPGPGIHGSAVVEAGAKVSALAHVGPNCTVCAGASVGPGSVLHAGSYVGPGASIGEGTVLHPGVRVLERCRVGARCVLHAGVTIGADGFGYRPAPGGGGLLKVPHIGDVVVEDGVEIGANSCVDRAKFGSTVVGAGTKIDNLVQIAHNCVIGRACIICGNCGIAGSVRIGDGAALGGGVGIADNIEIGAGAQVAAFSGVMNNVPPGEVWVGLPAGPAREYKRNYVAFRMLGRMMPQIRRLLRMDERAI